MKQQKLHLKSGFIGLHTTGGSGHNSFIAPYEKGNAETFINELNTIIAEMQ